MSKKYTNQIEKQHELEREIAYQNQMLSDQASEIDSIKLSMKDKQMENVPEKGDIIDEVADNEVFLEEEKEENLEDSTENSTVDTEAGGVYLKSYIVEPGDSLIAICNKQGIDYGSTYRIILSLNGIENANEIYVGQTILLPVEK